MREHGRRYHTFPGVILERPWKPYPFLQTKSGRGWSRMLGLVQNITTDFEGNQMAAALRGFIVFLIVLACCPPQARAKDDTVCPAVHETAIAIFIEPTDEEIALMKKENGEDFYTIADDALYYQSQAAELLQKIKFPFCSTTNESHEFIAKDNNKKYSVSKKCRGWCLILWNGHGEPIWTNAVDLFMHESYLQNAN